MDKKKYLAGASFAGQCSSERNCYRPFRKNVRPNYYWLFRIMVAFVFTITFFGAAGQLVFEKAFTTIATQTPKAIEIAPNGDVYVADTYNQRVLVYDPDGNYKFQFLTGALPMSIAIDASSNVFVLHPSETKKFDLSGFELPANGLSFVGGQQVAYDGVSNRLYITQDGCDCVKVYSTTGSLINTFGTNGNGPGQFQLPHAITVNQGKVYVYDIQLQRAHVFGVSGNYLSTIESTDICSSADNIPGGNIIQASENTNRLNLYSHNYNLVGGYGSYGEEDGLFNILTCVRYSSFNNRVYTLNQYGKIQVFSSPPNLVVTAIDAFGDSDEKYYYDNALLGSTGVSKTFSIRNVSWTETLSLTGIPPISISGPDASSFQLSGKPLPASLAPGEHRTFVVTFIPSKVGPHVAFLEVQSTDPTENPAHVDLLGLGTQTSTPVVMDINNWLSTHPSIASHLAWQKIYADPSNIPPGNFSKWQDWTPRQKADLQKAFALAFSKHFIYNALPDVVPEIPENRWPGTIYDNINTVTTINSDEAWQLFVNWVAHTLLLEAYNVMPWSIEAYDDESKALLLNSSRMMRQESTTSYSLTVNWEILQSSRRSVLGWTVSSAPFLTYNFLLDNGILQPGFDKRQVIEKLLEWCSRPNMSHFFGSIDNLNMEKHWQYRGGAPAKRIIDGTVSQVPFFNFYSHWTAGCHGTSGFLRSVLRAVNIPVELTIMTQAGHSVPIFRTENVFMSHGDDPYDGHFHDSGLPTSSLLIPGAFFNDFFGVDIANTLNNLTGPTNLGIQERLVSGTVYSQNVPVPNADIIFQNLQTVFEFPIPTTYNVQTDTSGNYSLLMMPGVYSATVSASGYNDNKMKVQHNNWPTVEYFEIEAQNNILPLMRQRSRSVEKVDSSHETGFEDEPEVYPNPFINTLEIKGNFSESARVTITDATGRTLHDGPHQPEMKVDVRPGIYLLTIKDKNITRTFKLIKQ